MKNLAIPVIVTALVVGAASGAAASFLAAPDDRPPPAVVPRSVDVPAEVREEIEALREENRDLLERVKALESRPASIETAPFDDKVMREELAVLAEKVQELSVVPQGASSSLPVDPSAPEGASVFADAVEKTLNTIRRREKAESWRAGTRKSQANLDQRLDRMRNSLNLTNNQVDHLRTAFVAEAERNLELIRAWEEGSTSREQLGETKRSNHEQHQQALSTILTPAQLEQYRSNQRGGGGK